MTKRPRKSKTQSGGEGGVSRLLAAYRLGYLSRVIRKWLDLSLEFPGDDEVWDSVPLSIDQLREARRVLTGEIKANAFSELSVVLNELDGLFSRLSESRNEGAETFNQIARGVLRSQAFQDLRRVADCALAEGQPSKGWYNLGVALGDYDLAHRDTYDGEQGSDQVDAAPDITPIVMAAHRLPSDEARKCPLLGSLIEISREKKGRTARAILKEFIDTNYCEGRLSTASDGLLSFTHIIDDVNTIIQDDLSNLSDIESRGSSPPIQGTSTEDGAARAMVEGDSVPPSVEQSHEVVLPWDAATDSRNKWFYEQERARVPLKKIIFEFKAIVQANPKLGWKIVTSARHIKNIATSYAKAHGFPEIPPRKPRKKQASSDESLP